MVFAASLQKSALLSPYLLLQIYLFVFFFSLFSQHFCVWCFRDRWEITYTLKIFTYHQAPRLLSLAPNHSPEIQIHISSRLLNVSIQIPPDNELILSLLPCLLAQTAPTSQVISEETTSKSPMLRLSALTSEVHIHPKLIQLDLGK